MSVIVLLLHFSRISSFSKLYKDTNEVKNSHIDYVSHSVVAVFFENFEILEARLERVVNINYTNVVNISPIQSQHCCCIFREIRVFGRIERHK